MNPLFKELADQLTESLNKGITDDAFKGIMKKVDDIRCSIEEDIEYRMRDDLAPNLTAFVADMAEKAVGAMLEGNDDQMRRYLGCERGHWTGRSQDAGEWGRKREDWEWHSVIHGKLFEQGSLALRKKIVESHRDLITDQRILDLEDQVKSLVAQVNRANAAKNEM
ncbi:MAG TPA: hypothetical protein VMS08_03595 [Candidatus Saccharimonadia bacterium]|nr:hypothetical protein [Candidatus Saccharimonadia bacterium]